MADGLGARSGVSANTRDRVESSSETGSRGAAFDSGETGAERVGEWDGLVPLEDGGASNLCGPPRMCASGRW